MATRKKTTTKKAAKAKAQPGRAAAGAARKTRTGRKPPNQNFKVTKAVCKKVERLAGKGLTMDQIADCIGLARSTLFKHKAASPELDDAIRCGRSKGIQEVSNALFESAKSGNVTAQIFYLKNRDSDNWRDVSHLKHDDAGRRALERFTRDDVKRVAENVLKQVEAEAAIDPMSASIDDEAQGHA